MAKGSGYFTLVAAAFIPVAALAVEPLPYSVRTKPYTGWHSGVRGDNTVIGMAGANVALPFNIGAAEMNPAGFAMLMGSVSAQITSTDITDRQIQSTDFKSKSSYYGLAVNPPPWGFAVTSYSPTMETGVYHAPITGNDVEAEMSVRELRFTGSRMFFDNTAALGISFDLAKANRNLGGSKDNRVSAGWKFGGLYKLPHHLTLGVTYSPQNTIGGNPTASALEEIPGFSQAIIMPATAGFGIGWTPNRFTQIGATVIYVSRTRDTALLKDERIEVGQYSTYQPRIGGTYTFFQFDHWKGEVALGSYYEVSRVQGEKNRFHQTASLDVNIYMFNTGIGIDRAHGYRNFMIGIGIDIIRTLREFDIVPKDNLPPYDGFFPPPYEISADGLSEGLSYGEEKSVPSQSLGDVQQIIEEAPGKISDKLKGIPVDTTHPSLRKKTKNGNSKGKNSKRKKKNSQPANPLEVPAP